MLSLSRRRLLIAAPLLLLPGRALAALDPTPGSTEGPFYPRELPSDQDNDLVRVEGAVRAAGGDVLHLAGTVRERDGRPAPGARVEIWQCDANGIYLHPGDRGLARRDTAFQGFGHAIADGEGRFAFRTIVPVPYGGRTPHIHLKVLRDGREVLTTQFYRAGFPRNESDFLFRRMSAAEQARVSMALRPRPGATPAVETEIEVVIA